MLAWQFHGEIYVLEEESDPMIISFGWTSDAMLAGFKDTTRRAWDPDYIRKMQDYGHFRNRVIMDVWNALPRVVSKSPEKIARVMLKADPIYSKDLPNTDYAREGFEWLERYGYTLGGIRPLRLWEGWEWLWSGNSADPVVARTAPLWIVRFNVIELTRAGRDRRDQLLQEGKEIRPLPMVA